MKKLLYAIILMCALLFSHNAFASEAHATCDPKVMADAQKPEVVFAVCVFADGTLIDHKGANSMSDCLKTKREVEKKWRNKSAEMDSITRNYI